jgi:hypothetical protein
MILHKHEMIDTRTTNYSECVLMVTLMICNDGDDDDDDDDDGDGG